MHVKTFVRPILYFCLFNPMKLSKLDGLKENLNHKPFIYSQEI